MNIGDYVQATSKRNPTLRIVGYIEMIVDGGYWLVTDAGLRVVSHEHFNIKEIAK